MPVLVSATSLFPGAGSPTVDPRAMDKAMRTNSCFMVESLVDFFLLDGCLSSSVALVFACSGKNSYIAVA